MDQYEPKAYFQSLFIPFTSLKAVHYLIFIGLIIYFKSLFNGFVADDTTQIVNNPLIHSISNIYLFFTGGTFNSNAGVLVGSFYRPISTTIMSLIYTLFGASSFHFHLIQVLLHISNTVMIYFLFKDIFKEKISFFLALIFLVHPINNETVNYIAASHDILFVFFGLLALTFVKNNKYSDKKTFVITSILLFLAMFSKESAILFLIIVPLYIFMFKKRSYLPYLGISSVILITYLFVRLVIANVGIMSNQLIPIVSASFVTKLLTIPQVIFFYLSTFIYPKYLISNHLWIVEQISFNEFIYPLLMVVLFILVIITCGYLIFRKKHSMFKYYIFFSAWTFAGLGLYIHIFPLDATVADRWFYFPMIGLLAMIGSVTTLIKIKNSILIFVISIVCLFIISLYAYRSVIRTSNWHNDFTLYEHDSKYKPNYLLESGYGMLLFNNKKYREAQIHLENSIKYEPNDYRGWNNLGTLYLYYAYSTKDKIYVEKSIEAFQRSIKNDKGNIAYSAHENLATAYYYYKDPKFALSFVNDALEKFPLDSKLWFTKALIEEKLGAHEEAIVSATRAYEIHPDSQTQALYYALVNGNKIDVNPSY